MRGRIRQVVTNLVDNALKFTKSGHVMIRVDSLDQTDTDVTFQMRVEDTGIGISEDKQHAIHVDKFTQADASTTREYGGTGLGLAICKQLIELMGGEIGVESDTGNGASLVTVQALFAVCSRRGCTYRFIGTACGNARSSCRRERVSCPYG